MDHQFVIYAKEDTKATMQIQAAISKTVRPDDVCWCGSLEELYDKFHFPRNYTAVIMVLESQADLKHILGKRDLFEDMKIFLVLPDNSDETIALAHKMFPRFITYTDANFTTELTAIIRKMIAMGQ